MRKLLTLDSVLLLEDDAASSFLICLELRAEGALAIVVSPAGLQKKSNVGP